MPARSWKFGPFSLAAASANNIALSQTPGGAGNLTLNGSTVTAGVATLDVARRVLLTTTADETAKTFTVYGTDRYGRTQSEVVAGVNNTTAFTVRDFLTITRIAVSAALAGAVTFGTNGVGSTAPLITDAFADQNYFGITTKIISGSVTFDIEITNEDFSPDWDLATVPPTWTKAGGLTGITTNLSSTINIPATMIRVVITAGTGSAQVSCHQPEGFTPI